MPEVKLDAVDAAELAEMLQFLSEWLARDPGRLGASLAEVDGHSCSVDYTWLVIPQGGSPAGGGLGGAGCPWAPHLSIGARGRLGSNGALFSVIGGRVLPPKDVQVRVELANGVQMTVEPHDA